MIGYWAAARAWLLPYGMLVWVAYVAVLLREGGEQKRKETVQNSPTPLLYGKWVTGWWVRQEAHVALVHLKLRSYGGKVRPKIQTYIENSTEREAGCCAVRELCRSICDTPTHHVSMGSKNGGGVKQRRRRRRGDGCSHIHSLWWTIALLRSQACFFRSSVFGASDAWSLNLTFPVLLKTAYDSCNIRYFSEWKWMLHLSDRPHVQQNCYLFL